MRNEDTKKMKVKMSLEVALTTTSRLLSKIILIGLWVYVPPLIVGLCFCGITFLTMKIPLKMNLEAQIKKTFQLDMRINIVNLIPIKKYPQVVNIRIVLLCPMIVNQIGEKTFFVPLHVVGMKILTCILYHNNIWIYLHQLEVIAFVSFRISKLLKQ